MTVTFDNFCGCISLKRGSFIIGYMNLVASIFFVIVSISFIIFGEYLLGNKEYNKGRSSDEFAGILIIVCSIALIISVIHLIFTIVLLVGLHQNKRKHVKVYLIFSTIFLVIYIIGSFSNWSILSTNVQNIYNFVGVYYLIVIRSYYFTMCEDVQLIQSTKRKLEVNQQKNHC